MNHRVLTGNRTRTAKVYDGPQMNFVCLTKGIDAEETANRIARALDTNQELLAALQALVERYDAIRGVPGLSLVDGDFDAARAAIAESFVEVTT